MEQKVNIAVFASHNGSDLQAIIDECKTGKIAANVCAVISNNSTARALERAKENEIPYFHISGLSVGQENIDNTTLEVLERTKADVIILAGYLRKLGLPVLHKYSNRIYNIHPSLLPKYGGKGMYGINVHRAVLEAKESVTGITIHKVNEKYDEGEIVAQTIVPVLVEDTPEILAERVLNEEHKFLKKVMYTIVDDFNRQF